MNKQDILRLIDNLPEEFNADELMYQLYVLRKVEIAEQDIRAGRTITHEELVRRSDA